MRNETKEALLKGASYFIEPIDFNLKMSEIGLKKDIIKLSKYQVGSKVIIEGRDLGIIKSLKIVRVQDISTFNMIKILKESTLTIHNNKAIHKKFKNWYNKQYGNYGDSPYIFLYELNKGEVNEKN